MRPLRLIIVLLGMLLPAAPLAGAEVRLDAARRAALADLPLLRGAPLAESELRGRVVVLAFFASWCPPCDAEFDALERARAAHGPVILALNIFETWGGLGGPQALERFLARKAPGFRVLGDGKRVAALFGEVGRIPTVFVFGRDGRPLLHFIHARGASKSRVSFEELEAAIRAGR